MSALPNLSPSSLESLALDIGATVHRPDGSVFNASGRSGVRRIPTPVARPNPEPTPEPVRPAPQDNTALLEMMANLLARQQTPPVVNVPETPPAQVVVQAPARGSWRFEFERNPDKTIKAIVATPFKE